MEKLIAWVEIPTTNFERAINFYGKILNTDFDINDFGEEKIACFKSGEGAISYSKGFTPSENGALVSFSVKDIDAALLLANELGGKTVIPKCKIEAEGRGSFATLIDCEGNKIGLYED